MTLPGVQRHRWLILSGILLIAGVLAFPLRETLYEVVVVPVAFVAWNLNLFYRSLSQGLWWWLVVFIVLFMLAFSLAPRPAFRRMTRLHPKPRMGQVESLAAWLRKAERGVYFKWLLANRLGKLAYQILLHRESGRPRSVFAPLVGIDWEPTQELQSFLEAGLHGSFVDFPHANGPGRRSSPLDYNIKEAVEFLESQVENGKSPQSPKDDH